MGRKTGKDPGKVTEVTYKAKKAVGGVIKFDCRPPTLCSNEISQSSLNEFVVSLQNTNRSSVSMWEMLLLIEYKDFELSDEHRYIIQSQVDQMLKNARCGWACHGNT